MDGSLAGGVFFLLLDTCIATWKITRLIEDLKQSLWIFSFFEYRRAVPY